VYNCRTGAPGCGVEVTYLTSAEDNLLWQVRIGPARHACAAGAALLPQRFGAPVNDLLDSVPIDAGTARLAGQRKRGGFAIPGASASQALSPASLREHLSQTVAAEG
jgi:hypothetical protein